LGHPGAGDAFTAGDGGLTGDLAGVELAPPLYGFAERADDRRDLRLLRRFGELRLTPTFGDGADDLAGGHAACEEADVASLKRPVGAEGYFYGLFAEFERTFDVVGSDMDNAEPDLWGTCLASPSEEVKRRGMC